MRPTVEGELILAAGNAKFGWLNAFAMLTRNCVLTVSVILKFLERAKSTFAIGRPRKIPIPAFPKRPMFSGRVHTGLLSGQPGTLNAAGLNQLLIERSAGFVSDTGDDVRASSDGIRIGRVESRE